MGGLFLAILAWVSRTCWPVLPGSRQQPLREASGPQPRAQFLICLSRINAGVAHALSGFEQSNLFQTYDVRRPEPAVATLPSSTGHQEKLVLDRQQKSAFEGVLGFVLCKHRREPNLRFSQMTASNLPINIIIYRRALCGSGKHACGSDKNPSLIEQRRHMWFWQNSPPRRQVISALPCGCWFPPER